MKNIDKTKQVAIKVTPKIWRQVNAAARKQEMYAAEWVRQLIIKELSSPTR